MGWKLHPCIKYKKKTAVIILFLITISVGIYFSFGWYWVIIASILLGWAILPYFLPSYYYLTKEGVKIKGIVFEKKKRWDEFKSYYKDKNGIFLSPFDKPTRLENFRGIYIRFNNNEEEVSNFISSQIKT
ncbi:MAG: hypothetical protein QMD71_02820 [bacterium]|nr:hypothetical protein [bacterium]